MQNNLIFEFKCFCKNTSFLSIDTFKSTLILLIFLTPSYMSIYLERNFYHLTNTEISHIMRWRILLHCTK